MLYAHAILLLVVVWPLQALAHICASPEFLKLRVGSSSPQYFALGTH